MLGTEISDHHGDHRRLLWQADEATPRVTVDAIIVPTARPVLHLKQAARAAHSLGCPLVTLHSRKWTSAHAASHYLRQTNIDLIAIDMPEPTQLGLPELATSRLLAGSIFERRTDTSAKRNLALVLSHMLGWERVVFLDDDIQVPDPGDLSRAAGLLDTHTAVGLGNAGFPDNSVVCHAFRDSGGKQETFIGGGALAVEVKRNHSFFPNIYNEDWFYVLDGGKCLQSVATVGKVIQKAYDPYRNTERARNEELGDVLAEGIYWLLDQGKTVLDGNLAHWREFLEKRQRFIEKVLDMVKESDLIESSQQRARMVEALKAAQGRRARIRPQLCVDYLRAWISDQERWQQHIQRVPSEPGRPWEEVLDALSRSSGTRLSWCTKVRCSVPEPPRRPGRPRTMSVQRLRPLLPSDLQTSMMPLVVPTGPLTPPVPVLAGTGPSHAAHALETANVALASQEGQAESDGYGNKRPSEHLHG